MSFPQPKSAEVYYSACEKIDGHNRHRQDTLNTEKKVEVKTWGKRFNMSLFAMMVVDTCLAFTGCTRAEEVQKEFYMLLAEELIGNSFDVGQRSQRARVQCEPSFRPNLTADTGIPRSGVAAHITPTKRRRLTKYGTVKKHRMHGRCMECNLKTTFLCSLCVDDKSTQMHDCRPGDPWICPTKTDKLCFSQNMNRKHGV